jgi:hypothetical protein
MKRNYVLLIIIILVFIVGFVLLNFMQHKKNTVSESKICFKDKCFIVELAKNNLERATGLMNRENLENDKGMLFIFDSDGEYNFWMKNTLIPLDIIWISSDKKVIFIKNSAQPCKQEICESIRPGVIAKYVLEINGGLAETLGIKEGDEVVMDY